MRNCVRCSGEGVVRSGLLWLCVEHLEEALADPSACHGEYLLEVHAVDVMALEEAALAGAA